MIVSIDPGGATGLCKLGSDGTFATLTCPDGFNGMSDSMSQWKWHRIEAVVIENFVPRGGALSIQLDALHIIGAVQHECRQRVIPLILQTPTQAKSFASNDALKAVGWYTVGADHERDAARHMLCWLCTKATSPYLLERERVFNALAAL